MFARIGVLEGAHIYSLIYSRVTTYYVSGTIIDSGAVKSKKIQSVLVLSTE